MKTLIELFDMCQIENVIAGLRFEPEKIIFVGFDKVMKDKYILDLKRFFKLRGLDIKLEFKKVSRYDYNRIYSCLEEIIDSNSDCCFDLTGGKELVLTAMGELSATRNIPMVQFNIRTGNLIRVKNSQDIEDLKKSSMTIEECIALNGGTVVKETELEYNWDFSEEFKKDIITMWDICRFDCQEWNVQANMFDMFVKNAKMSPDGSFKLKLSDISYNSKNNPVNDRILTELKNNGIIDYTFDGDNFSFDFKNDQIRQCLTKAGNILELYGFFTAKNIEEKEKGFYDDIDVGIFVDWDGIIHEDDEEESDTRNEIDLIFMRDLVPVFISCKNGQVHKESLYELFTVGEKFGGEYARKILLCTYISNDPDKKENILRRARDMKIEVIEGIDKLTCEQFEEVLKRRTK